MNDGLLKIAEQLAIENDLVYAPDDAAVRWMNLFSDIIAIGERERCAQICDDMGYPKAAKRIRENSK